MSALDALQLLVGVPAVLLLPGWAWSLAVFPRSRPLGAERSDGRLDLVERLAVSLALSIALVSLAALLWNGALGLPLGFGGSAALVALLTAAGVLLGGWRRRRSVAAMP